MPESARKTPRRPSNLDPGLIRVANVVGWCWLAVCAVGAIVFTALQVPRLMSTVWLFSPGGRSTPDTALSFATSVVVLCVWLLIVIFAVVMVLSQRFSAPNRAWLVVLVALLVWLAGVVVASVVVSAASQLGLHTALDESSAFGLVAPIGRPATFIVGLAALVTVIGLPLLALLRRRKQA
ncbi:MAG: hypothetical protein ABI400_08320 [Lacisediminihabitans sp.]